MEDTILDELKQEATELGIKFQANIGAEKLQSKIDAYYDSQETSGKELQEAVAANEAKEQEKSEEKSAASSKKKRAIDIAMEMKAAASKTRVVTIIDNDQRVNNQTTTVPVNCSNEYFDLGQLILPLNTPIEVRQGHIDVLKEVKIPQHVRGQNGGSSYVRIIPRYTIAYEDNK